MAANFTCPIINPENPDGPRVNAIFPGTLTLKYFKYTPTRYMNLIAAKFVLEHTQRIFFGVREYNEGGWCYAGRPKSWYITQQRIEAFPDNMVFAVYLNPNLHVYECRAEFSDSEDRESPSGWKNRYRGVTWKSIS